MRPLRETTALIVASLTALLLAACSSSPERTDLSHTSHVHNVVVSESVVYAGSHEGLYALQDDGSWVRQGPSFDVMGLSASGGTLFASGHPGAELDAPDPIGIIESNDGGESWSNHSLSGEVDFHLLENAQGNFVGVAANYGVLIRSDDDGQTWSSLEVATLSDIAVDPSDPNRVALIADGELLLSVDAGNTFQPSDAPAGLALVDWSQESMLLASETELFVAASPEGPFEALPQTFSNMTDLAHSGETIAVLAGDSVLVSVDNGQTFTTY